MNAGQAGVNKLRVSGQMDGQGAVENTLGIPQANGPGKASGEQIIGSVDNTAIDVYAAVVPVSQIGQTGVVWLKKIFHALRIETTGGEFQRRRIRQIS